MSEERCSKEQRSFFGLNRQAVQSRRYAVFRFSDLILLILGTHKLARLIAKDRVTAPVRAAFTEFEREKISIREQTEVLSLVGDITISEGKPNIHAHVVLGKRNGSAWGGHLIEAEVRPTLEVALTESPAHMERRFNKDAGLALISLN